MSLPRASYQASERNRKALRRGSRPIHAILVPVDYSEPSFRAAALARVIAKGVGASLTLLHLHIRENAVRETVHVEASHVADVSEAQLESLLTHLVGDASQRSLQALLGHGRARFEESRLHSREKVIEDYAAAHAIDLIVIGAHLHSRLQDILMGNIAKHLVENAPCPVMVLH